MITRRLWLKFRFPPEWHPLYPRVTATHAETVPWYIWGIGVLFAPIIILLAVVFTATAYSIIWALNISSAIGKEYQLGTYDLMCVTPPGELGINWVICTGCIHRNFSFERLHSGGLWLIRFSIGFLLLSTTFDSSPFPQTYSEITVIRVAVYAAIGLALIIDHYQAVVMSNLIGMIVPTYVKDTLLLRLIAPGSVLFVQFTSYLVVGLIAFVALPEAASISAFRTDIHDVILIGMQVITFFVVREGIVLILWRFLLHRFAITITEADHVLDWSNTGWL